jgi:hypothetical protein
MGLGSEIRDPEKIYSGSRIQGQKGTGSRIRIRNTGNVKKTLILVFYFYFSSQFYITVFKLPYGTYYSSIIC